MIRFNLLTRTAAAALFGLGFATAAAAHDGPYVVGSGENASVVYPTPSANVVGGALTRTVGSGESTSTEVIDVQNVQAGRTAQLVGSGENQTVIYLDPAPARSAVAMARGGVQG
jgi:hypothetical protein